MFRGSSLVLGCIVTITLGVSAFAGALSTVSGVAEGVSNAAASAVGTATGTVSGVTGTATGAVSGVAGAAGSTVSSGTSAVAGAVGDAAGAVSSVAGTAGTAVGEATAPLDNSDPLEMGAQWVSKDLLKFRGSFLKFRGQQVTIVKRDRAEASGALPAAVQSELVVDSCTRFLDQFKVLQTFSRADLFKNCPDIARQNGAQTAGQ